MSFKVGRKAEISVNFIFILRSSTGHNCLKQGRNQGETKRTETPPLAKGQVIVKKKHKISNSFYLFCVSVI